MRKLMIAAIVGVLTSVGAVRHAGAQAFYPNGSANVPTHGGYSTNPGGYQGYPSQHPAYPQQYPATSHPGYENDHHARRDDRDSWSRRNDSPRYGQGVRDENYGRYSTTSGVPSRIAAAQRTTRSRTNQHAQKLNHELRER